MKKTRWLRPLTTLLLVLALSIPGLALAAQENTLPLTDTPVTLTVYRDIGSSQQANMKDLSEHPVVRRMVEETGVTLEFIHPPVGDDGTFFNTTIASGEWPDLIYTNLFDRYPGGIEGAMDDGILINIDGLIEEYAPNFLALLETQGDDIQKMIRGDGGAITRFGTMFLPPFVDGRIHNGFVVRKDWLDKYDLTPPVTLEEYTNVLRTFKENGVEVPLALPRFGELQYMNNNPIASAFGVCFNDFQLLDGKVAYSRTLPAYKDFLAQMNAWASEGLIDRDLVSRSQDDTVKLFYNGRAGMSFFHNSNTRTALTTGALEDPDYDLIGLPYPRVNADDELTLSRQVHSVNQYSWVVSSTCKNPELAVRFIDYLHMEPTRLMTAWGLGNEEYPTFVEDEEGNRTFTDFMNNNPDFDFPTCRSLYTLDQFQVMYDEMMERQQYNLPQNIQVWEAWATGNSIKDKIPTLISMSAEESREYTEIKARMDNYADEMVYKFIFGEESLDKFDEFVDQLNAMGAERATEITQDAYTRFMNR